MDPIPIITRTVEHNRPKQISLSTKFYTRRVVVTLPDQGGRCRAPEHELGLWMETALSGVERLCLHTLCS